MKNTNNKWFKVTTITLATMLIIGVGSTAGVYALSKTGDYNLQARSFNVADTSNSSSSTTATGDGNPSSKDETVYIMTNSDGETNKVIVSDWLKNENGVANLNDISELQDITNVKGDETVTSDSNNKQVWSSNGNDIYYQGTTDKTLPVNIKITYTLDGKEIKASELKGKSGKLTMHIEYINNQKETVKIGNKNENIYVPFVMVSGMILDNDTFKNVEIKDGKILNDGDKTAVMVFAIPGLKESLDIKDDTITIPSSADITCDVENCELPTIMTVATNDLLNSLQIDGVEDIDDLNDAIAKLTDASNQLVNGSSDLYDGLNTLLTKSNALVDGVGQLASSYSQINQGIKAVNQGVGSLNQGAGKIYQGTGQLKTAINTLNAGLNSLAANNDSINGGAKQVFDTLLSTSNTQLKAAGLEVPQLTIDNYAKVLDGVVAGLTQKEQAVQGNEAALQQLEVAKQTIVALKGQLDSYNTFYTGLKQYTAGVAQASAGSSQISAGMSDLETGSKELSQGTQQLSDSLKQLVSGSSQFNQGLSTLNSQSGALIDGITQLIDGSETLKDGMKEFNDTGIQKLADVFSGDINNIVDRFNAISNMSKQYNNFSGIQDGVGGSVKFIFKTEDVTE